MQRSMEMVILLKNDLIFFAIHCSGHSALRKSTVSSAESVFTGRWVGKKETSHKTNKNCAILCENSIDRNIILHLLTLHIFDMHINVWVYVCVLRELRDYILWKSQQCLGLFKYSIIVWIVYFDIFCLFNSGSILPLDECIRWLNLA